jgi:[ribosomal protein S5]-alanine N-acetyltransferase
MEKMPYRDRPGLRAVTPSAGDIVSSNWREQLPVLSGAQVELRELRGSDAPSLFAMLTSEEVARFISPPPTTLEGFENFIAWTHRQRSAGAYACFAVTLKGYDTAIGLFQVRELDPGFATAEWGFAIGSAFWGTGVFKASADLVLEFVFDTLGVHRLEARAAVRNGRGTGALRKTGAVQEGLLRKSFLRNGEYLDQVLYAILSDDWRTAREEGLNPRASLRIH